MNKKSNVEKSSWCACTLMKLCGI